MNKKKILSKTAIVWISSALLFLAGTGFYIWNRFGPSQHIAYTPTLETTKMAKTLDSASHSCDLTVRSYRQIGREMQFELAANGSGLAPYDVEISQEGSVQSFKNVAHRYGIWLTLTDVNLKNGPAYIKVVSLGQNDCQTKAAFEFDGSRANDILEANQWIRQGSKDNWLDVRPVQKNGQIFLKDFANYSDGRTRVIMIDGIVVNDLDKGMEVRPGYLYSITARWIDAPYNDWWNKLKNRSLRQQNIWIAGKTNADEKSALAKIEIPAWFSPSKGTNVEFDTRFPEFDPIKGKIVAQYRLNENVSPENYFKRGVTYLNGAEKDIPSQKLHWTATPNLFADRDENWFGGLPRNEVESLARVPDLGVYAMDYEFWNQHYTPAVKQNLIWFTERIRKDHPNLLVMDYWGGGAYVNPHITKSFGKNPLDYVDDYYQPKSNNPNFEPLPNGQSFKNLFNVAPVDVYPKAMFPADEQGNSTNNFVLLSAIHSQRINRLIPYQKNDKLIFYGWNKYQPLYNDPIVPWNLSLTNPRGELILNQLEMMPASQALSMSMFSLILFDGYYLWNDSGPSGNDPNGYYIPEEGTGWGKEWYPADGKTNLSEIAKRKKNAATPQTPAYWDFPTEYYVLGNWMAKQVEDILIGGINKDLPFEINGQWTEPKKEQVLLAISKKEPFVTSIVKGNQIAVLAVDSFQAPNAVRKVNIKLPDGSQTSIELYGNWPVLYRGKLKN